MKKVEDLIKTLEEHKDKNLYSLERGNPNSVLDYEIHIVEDNLFLEFSKTKIDNFFISDFENLDEGFTPRRRTDIEMEIFKKQEIVESRAYDYRFEIGDEVQIDESVMPDIIKDKHTHLFGKKGVIKKVQADNDIHYHGISYNHVVLWEDGSTTKDMEFNSLDCDEFGFPNNFLSTVYLIKL